MSAELDPFAAFGEQPQQPQQPPQPGAAQQEPVAEFDPFAQFVVPEKVNEVEADIASGEWTNRDSLAGALIFIEGATLGWSDEVGIGLASVAQSAVGEETQEEVYARLRKDYDAMQEGFAEDHPGAAIGLEIAGAVVSPVSKVKMASSLTGLLTRGAAEGAAYGAGKAEDTDSMATEGLKGALGGAVGAGAVGSFGWLFKRKVQAPLDTPDGFVPLTLAADKSTGSGEALLQTFYRDVIGPSWGGKGLIRAQEEVTVAPLVAAQKHRAQALVKIKEATSAEAGEAKKQLSVALSNLKDTTSAKGASITDATQEAKDIIGGNYGGFLGKDGAIMVRATKRVQDAIEVNSDAFRLAAFTSSVPAGAKKVDIEDVLNAGNPNVAMLRLENLWVQEGFKSIKGRSFTLKPEVLMADINKRVSENPQLRLLAVSKSEVSSLVKNSLELLADKRNPATGRISGEDLSAVRSAFGTAAATKSDAGGQSVLMQNLYREVQSAVDQQMRAQLSPKGLKAFDDDLAAWATHSILKDSVFKASKKTGVNGKFTPDDWLSAIAGNSVRQSRQGKGPLRAEAEGIAAANKSHEKSIVSAANKLSEKMTTRRQREITRVANKAKTERAFLAEQVKKQRSVLHSNPEVATKLAENTQRMKALDQEIEEAGEQLLAIKKARTPENPGWFHSFAATGALASAVGSAGFAVAGPVGGGLSLGAAMKAGQVMSAPTVQRTLAGQAAPQVAMQKAMQTPTGKAVRQVSPLLGARFGSMFTQE